MMIRFLRASIVVAAMFPALTWAQCTVSDTADYRLDFNATWSAETLPPQFPANAHFSGLVGGSHNAQVTFWEDGELASDGIESMAETGNKGTLVNEVSVAIGAGTALEIVSGDGIGQSPEFVSTTFTVDQAHPLASVVSMIAPSPDWFVGVNSLNLFSGGNWLADISVELFGYDAGTDSGINYTSGNNDTQPPEPISALTGAMFMHDGALVPFGTFRFVLLTESCLDTDEDNVADDEDNCVSVANASQIDADGDGIGNRCDADLDNNCAINFLDLGLLKSVFFSANSVADLNVDGAVNFLDLGIMKAAFFGSPGPSGIANICD